MKDSVNGLLGIILPMVDTIIKNNNNILDDNIERLIIELGEKLKDILTPICNDKEYTSACLYLDKKIEAYIDEKKNSN